MKTLVIILALASTLHAFPRNRVCRIDAAGAPLSASQVFQYKVGAATGARAIIDAIGWMNP